MKSIKINIPVRFKNPVFLAQIGLSIAVPILTYFGLETKDITTWQTVGDLLIKAISNPYVVGLIILSVWNAINDPTVKGLSDSSNAMNYIEPKENVNSGE